MTLETRHPLYLEHAPDVQLLRDCWEGERRIKERGTLYLPPTSGMVHDGMGGLAAPGQVAYDAYRARARFPDLVRDAVKALLGVMHRKPAVIQVPPAMEGMLERATLLGENMQQLLQRVNQEQLISGRCGLLADVQNDGTFHLALYRREAAINWDDANDDQDVADLSLVVLDESGLQRSTKFEWDNVTRFRVLDLAGEGEGKVYRSGLFRMEGSRAPEFLEESMIAPSHRGRELDRIPFVFVNPVDCSPVPERPPLLGLANIALGIYRGEADYRHTLFMQGQDTLVVIGAVMGEAPGAEETRVGAGAVIKLPQGGDAKFIGVGAAGLSEQRQALAADRAEGQQHSGHLLDSVSRQAESGEALRVRVAARTTTVKGVALAGAYALERVLRHIAEWMGIDPTTVVVTPNLDFVDDMMEGQSLVSLVSAKNLGAKLSHESIHRIMQERGLTHLTYEEELAAIANEEPTMPEPAAEDIGDDPAEEDEDEKSEGETEPDADDSEDEPDDEDRDDDDEE